MFIGSRIRGLERSVILFRLLALLTQTVNDLPSPENELLMNLNYYNINYIY